MKAGTVFAVGSHLATLAWLAALTVAPGPGPARPPYQGPLFPRLILPQEPTAEQLALRDNPRVVSASASLAGGLVSYKVNDPIAVDAGWDVIARSAGGPPVVLYLQPGGVLNRTGRADEASITADLMSIRGLP